jgi:8-amino-7-oxononanoate synthase
MTLKQRLAKQNKTIKNDHQWRERKVRHGSVNRLSLVDDQEKILFCSSDYLGLSAHPLMQSALTNATIKYGVGSGSSALVAGYHRETQKLEIALASWLEVESCMVFSNAYMANLAWASSLIERHDAIWMHRHNHASLWDGCRLTHACIHRYNDLPTPEKIKLSDHSLHWIISDAVFSMTGQCPNFADLIAIDQASTQHELVLDDAHGIGVFGPKGRGSLAHFGHHPTQVRAIIGGFGKAFGCYGGFIAGENDLIEMLYQKARSYRFTTALPTALMSTASQALELIIASDDRREQLQANIAYFKDSVSGFGLGLQDSDHPIQSLVLGSSEKAAALEKYLWERGIWVRAMRPPVVSESGASCRIIITANHRKSDIDQLTEALERWQNKLILS